MFSFSMTFIFIIFLWLLPLLLLARCSYHAAKTKQEVRQLRLVCEVFLKAHFKQPTLAERTQIGAKR